MKTVNVKDVERINDLINKAELENAKNQGILENIRKEWMEKYGTDDVKIIKQKLKELKSDLENSNERQNKLYNELMELQDWEQLEEDLE